MNNRHPGGPMTFRHDPPGRIQVTLKPGFVVRRLTREEVAERARLKADEEALRRAKLAACVCCDRPTEERDFIPSSTGTPSETCTFCGNGKPWRFTRRAQRNPLLARMEAINNTLRREIRHHA